MKTNEWRGPSAPTAKLGWSLGRGESDEVDGRKSEAMKEPPGRGGEGGVGGGGGGGASRIRFD